MNRREIGGRIRAIRAKRRMTRQELGERSGCGHRIGSFERGDRMPDQDAVGRIAKALCVPRAYLTQGVHGNAEGEQPCWTCAHICDYTCQWAWELRPIPGWKAAEKQVKARDEGYVTLIHIDYCPQYDEGEDE